ncbi:EAL domain-containing protein [Clostridium grantii]|uniref:Diguanylate cyclase (GGDEF) domain-containing protein n=1 Tax=Clostridium grantii DSM 8605 TaxID=1121316 RepID=A0A1M5WU81_9CLOT|nr:EAL domain-containing protein [Clostridium grantii]SHH90654.1 diguanylate cyclase (GGDEF) domain-containing protein [Clostridium grantii DSM 8605]
MRKIVGFYKQISVANKNIFVLMMTILPFILGIGISMHKNPEMRYFGAAINISGSQRMRTMLISNFSQKIGTEYLENNEENVDSIRKLLESEVFIYEEYMEALVYGDESIKLDKNKYDNIVSEINKLLPLTDKYIEVTKNIISDPSDMESIDFIVDNSLELKDEVDKIVGLYEKQYEIEVKIQKNINIWIVIISIILTGFGFVLTKKIKQNEKFAKFDYLTGLKNKSEIYVDLKGKDVRKYSAFFIDLDKFKLVNDTFGHLIGDEIIIKVANRIQKLFEFNSVYRYGGDEFLVLRESENIDEVNLFNERLMKNIKVEMGQPFIDSKGRKHYLSFSMGIVTNNAGLKSFEKLIEFSDDLMYDSKNYPNKVSICDTVEKAEYRIELKNDTMKVMQNKEIFAKFQPIYDLNKNIKGLETLARWKHKGKIINPINFIPIIYRNGFIEEFDLYMIKHAGLIYKEIFSKNPIHNDFFYSINITKDTLYNFNINGMLSALRESPIPRDKIIIEVLEEVIIDKDVIDKLEILHEKGFKIAIDDFSAGNTSIDSLKIKYISFIKIAKSITDELIGNEYNIKLLDKLVVLIHSLDKKVVVEGVETKEQFDLLSKLKVDLIQGYYLSKPRDPKDL